MKGSIRVLVGFLIVLGAAGSDCDGACMENALSLSEIMLYSLLGMSLIVWGGIAMKQEQL